MGACTSRQKQHKRLALNNSTVIDNKQLSPLLTTVLPNQRPQSLLTGFDVQSSLVTEPIVHQTESSSLIQLYSSNTNNNNNNSNINNWMSSSSSTSNISPRIPVTKSRLPVHQSQSSSTTSIRPTNASTKVGTTNPLGNHSSLKHIKCIPLNSMTVYLFHLY
jgi:hypothetical protein